jgi:hypothetical protein
MTYTITHPPATRDIAAILCKEDRTSRQQLATHSLPVTSDKITLTLLFSEQMEKGRKL